MPCRDIVVCQYSRQIKNQDVTLFCNRTGPFESGRSLSTGSLASIMMMRPHKRPCASKAYEVRLSVLAIQKTTCASLQSFQDSRSVSGTLPEEQPYAIGSSAPLMTKRSPILYGSLAGLSFPNAQIPLSWATAQETLAPSRSLQYPPLKANLTIIRIA